MKERPITFTAESVLGILDGTKTMTRRVVTKIEPSDFIGGRGEEGDLDQWGWEDPDDGFYWVLGRGHASEQRGERYSIPCPHGEVGDVLWVREAWRTHALHDELRPADLVEGTTVSFDADAPGTLLVPGRYRHARYMPRWASRIALCITSVRVERLQDITQTDIAHEGLSSGSFTEWTHVWDDINAKRDGGAYSWARNPFVWVIAFR